MPSCSSPPSAVNQFEYQHHKDNYVHRHRDANQQTIANSAVSQRIDNPRKPTGRLPCQRGRSRLASCICRCHNSHSVPWHTPHRTAEGRRSACPRRPISAAKVPKNKRACRDGSLCVLPGSDFLVDAGQHCDNLRAKYTVSRSCWAVRPDGWPRRASAAPCCSPCGGDWGFGVSSADPQNAVAAGGVKSLDSTRAVVISVSASETEAAYTEKWPQHMMSRTRKTPSCGTLRSVSNYEVANPEPLASGKQHYRFLAIFALARGTKGPGMDYVGVARVS